MRVVFDTNVFVSGVLWGGLPGQAIDTIRKKLIVLVSSQALVDELRIVLSRSKFAERLVQRGTSVDAVMADYIAFADVAESADIGTGITVDPKDDKFLACAVGGKAVLVVSGDHHLLELQKFRDVEIITVLEFLKRVYPQPE